MMAHKSVLLSTLALLILHCNACISPEALGRHGYCAMIYETRGCTGWGRGIRDGQSFTSLYYELGEQYQDSISSVVVSPGCTFTGYEHSGFGGSNVSYDEGTHNVDRLNDAISSVYCYCEDQALPSAQAPQETASNEEDPDRASKCVSSRLLARYGYCAMIYEGGQCGSGRWKPKGINTGETFTSLSGELGREYQDSISSVVVSPGCTFTGYEHSGFGGDYVSYKEGAHNVGRLNNAISSAHCYCNED